MKFPGILESTSLEHWKITREPAPLGSKDFLLRYPPGAYTTMRTVDRSSVMDLGMHIDRMKHAVCSIKFHQLSQNEEDPEVTRNMKKIRQDKEGYLGHWIRKSSGKLIKEFLADLTDDTQECKITVLLYVDFDTLKPVLAAHCDHLTTLSGDFQVDVEVQGSPRHCATAKDSKWIREREEKIKQKFNETNEVLLHVDGKIYEGMTSNFFAVVDDTLYTAPLDSVLPGTIQKLVFEACNDFGINIKFEFPDITKQKWTGAFLSSTSRIVLNVGRVYDLNGNWMVLNTRENHLVKQIRNRVWELMREKAETVITD